MSGIARFGPDETGPAAKALGRDGVVLLDRFWPSADIASLHDAVLARHPELTDAALLRDRFELGDGRFSAPVTIGATLRGSGVFDHPAVEALLASVLGEDFVYDAFGTVMAQAGCPAQRRHRDGGLLFPETGVDRVLPPAALTLFVPLVAVTSDNAPTAFWPGSHRFDKPAAKADPVVPEVPLGSALLWDYRILHRGLANDSERHRPALYFSAGRPFWFDHKNFGRDNRRLIAEVETMAELGKRYARAEPV